MEELKSWIETHPYVTGSVVLGIIVLILVSRGGSSSRTVSAPSVSAPVQTGNGSTNQTAQLQAATQIAAQQNNAVLQTNLANAGLAAKQLDDATKVTIAGYQRDVALKNLDLSASAQANSNTFAYKTTLSNNETALEINRNNNATTLGVATVQAKQQDSLIQSLINSVIGGGSKTSTTATSGGSLPFPISLPSSQSTNYARPVASFPPAPVATTGTGPIGSLRGR